MECVQLFLAAKEGDIATIETLIYVKYIDVNSRTPWCIYDDDDVRITGYHTAMYSVCIYLYICIVIKWWLFMHVRVRFQLH